VKKNRKIIMAAAIIIAFLLMAGMFFLAPATAPKEANNKTGNLTIVKSKDLAEPKKPSLSLEIGKCTINADERKNNYEIRADVKNASAEVELRITYFDPGRNFKFGSESSVFKLSPGHAISRRMTSAYGASQNLPLDIMVFVNQVFSEEKKINLTCEKESSSGTGRSASPALSPATNPTPNQPPNPPPNPTPKPTCREETSREKERS